MRTQTQGQSCEDIAERQSRASQGEGEESEEIKPDDTFILDF